VKELIPEFFDQDCFDFLINSKGLQLGTLQNGERVNDVLLPSWAKSAKSFLKQNRAALESDYCTQHLPKWIDLIFGASSRGSGAKAAKNLFHPMAYLGPDEVDAIPSPEGRAQAELQSTEFGIVP
jgi:factor associated with neutral sphingomyelinase activation